ncbi:MAG: ATP-binding cassette domain-containing protein [Chloroflexi bacterium]|nr:ATP-binding cassette domain-containing protein [Chloroflexota bacterium]
MALLEVNDIHAFYGNIHALKGVTISVDEGEIVSLIGGNGAGKTTTLRTICGLINPREGSVIFEGEDIIMYPAHQLVNVIKLRKNVLLSNPFNHSHDEMESEVNG